MHTSNEAFSETQGTNPGSPSNLANDAHIKIKNAIIRHEIKGGEKVSEQRLVERFALTKAATRTAIKRLIADGLMTAESPKTTIVTPLTLAGVRSVFQARNILEPEAAKLAAGKVDPTSLQKLNERCRAGYRFGDGEQEFAFLTANRNFHLEIARSSQNSFLSDFISQLHDHAMRILWISLKIENRAEVWQHGHEDIIEALLSGDSFGAGVTALTHLQSGQRLVYEILSSSNNFGDIQLG